MWYEKIHDVWAITTVVPIIQQDFRLPDLFTIVCQIPQEYDLDGLPYEMTHYMSIVVAPPKKGRPFSRNVSSVDYDICEIFSSYRVLSYSHLTEFYRVHEDVDAGRQEALWHD